jgi:hypothetical protein
VSTLIATSELSDAKVSQIRLILRSKTQWLWRYYLSIKHTKGAEQSGLKLSEPNLADIQNEISLILMPMHLL